MGSGTSILTQTSSSFTFRNLASNRTYKSGSLIFLVYLDKNDQSSYLADSELASSQLTPELSFC